MSDEQNIPGVPEGLRLTGLIARQTDTTSGPHPGVYYEAILERIPKPKKWVILAEFEIPLDAHPSEYALHAVSAYPGRSVIASRSRVEERDA